MAYTMTLLDYKFFVARRMIFALNYRGIYRGKCEEHHQQIGQDSNRVPAKSHLLPLYRLARLTCMC
jgi:hypothetical protein